MKLKVETRKQEWDSVVVDQSEIYRQNLVSFLSLERFLAFTLTP